MLRSLAVVAGCLIVAATAHVVIMSSGGYGTPTAPLQIAVALGLCTGSVCIGSALSDGRWLLAWVFLITIVCGEAYAILTTSEVTLAARDATAAPLAELATKRKSALAALAALEAETPKAVDGSQLTAALTTKTAAEAAVREKAADKSCRKNCRMLLQSAIDAAQREVAAARAEFDEKTRIESQRLEERRAAARAAVTTPSAISNAAGGPTSRRRMGIGSADSGFEKHRRKWARGADCIRGARWRYGGQPARGRRSSGNP